MSGSGQIPKRLGERDGIVEYIPCVNNVVILDSKSHEYNGSMVGRQGLCTCKSIVVTIFDVQKKLQGNVILHLAISMESPVPLFVKSG